MRNRNGNQLKASRLLDAAPLMKGDPVHGPSLHIDDPWHKLQGEALVAAAAKDGRLSPEQASNVHYLYLPQRDGSLFCAVAILSDPGLILGTSVPPDAWRRQ